MKIAFASEDDQGLRGTLCTDFGRCPYYTLVEMDGDKVRNIKTVTNQYLNSDVSSMVPVFVKSLGARVIIAGGMKPQVVELFDQFEIEVVTTGPQGSLEDILFAYLRGDIEGALGCEHHH